MLERTLAIIKPDAVRKKIYGNIISIIESNKVEVEEMKLILLSTETAKKFYAIHKEKSFYNDLVKFMTSGKVVVMILKGEDVINKWRTMMGATDPAKAEVNSIRYRYADSIQNNCVHGSDSVESSEYEISVLFSKK